MRNTINLHAARDPGVLDKIDPLLLQYFTSYETHSATVATLLIPDALWKSDENLPSHVPLSHWMLLNSQKCDWLFNFIGIWPARCSNILYRTKKRYHPRLSSLARECSLMSHGHISHPRQHVSNFPYSLKHRSPPYTVLWKYFYGHHVSRL